MRHHYQILPATPARCAEQLANGEADIGLIPTVEYQRIPNLLVIPEIAVAAANEVRSVLLVRPHGRVRIRSVALDTSSRTSVALLKLLLHSRMGLAPEYVPCKPNVSDMLHRCDAALIIGDAALRCTGEEYEIMDLAAAWRDWQAKPFVFAFWACRAETALPEHVIEIFQEARDWGLARIEEIAAAHALSLGLPAAFLEEYLRRNLDHVMGPEHREGLERFYRLAFEAGLINSLKPVRFVPNAESA
jgi:chorismate dehydratase